MIFHVLGPECTRPMEGLSIRRQYMFEVLIEQVRMPAALCLRCRPVFRRVYQTVVILLAQYQCSYDSRTLP